MGIHLSSGKQELIIASPLLNSSGMLGFSDELRSLISIDSLGAFVTNPVSLRPRFLAQGNRSMEHEAGLLLHTGLPNPGLDNVLKIHQARWRRMSCPVILHLIANHSEEMEALIDRLDNLDAVQAIEVGLMDQEHDLDCRIFEAACRGMLPTIARVPVNTHVDRIIEFEQIGAAAIALGPPRASLFQKPGWVSGRLYGPGLLPLTLDAVRRTLGVLSCELIPGPGVFSRSDAETLLSLGVGALQLDSILWTNPDAFFDPPLGQLPAS
jgi:dihydroorotate dehydrogenase (NAD+) catalytic subunit